MLDSISSALFLPMYTESLSCWAGEFPNRFYIVIPSSPSASQGNICIASTPFYAESGNHTQMQRPQHLRYRQWMQRELPSPVINNPPHMDPETPYKQP
jgi:hypothetical protein